jgi:hypothetical protein
MSGFDDIDDRILVDPDYLLAELPRMREAETLSLVQFPSNIFYWNYQLKSAWINMSDLKQFDNEPIRQVWKQDDKTGFYVKWSPASTELYWLANTIYEQDGSVSSRLYTGSWGGVIEVFEQGIEWGFV